LFLKGENVHLGLLVVRREPVAGVVPHFSIRRVVHRCKGLLVELGEKILDSDGSVFLLPSWQKSGLQILAWLLVLSRHGSFLLKFKNDVFHRGHEGSVYDGTPLFRNRVVFKFENLVVGMVLFSKREYVLETDRVFVVSSIYYQGSKDQGKGGDLLRMGHNFGVGLGLGFPNFLTLVLAVVADDLYFIFF
jgi:hypothetical protein